MKVDAYDMLGLLQTVSYLAGTFGLLGRVSDSAIVKSQMHDASAALKNCADDIRMMFDSSDEIDANENEQLKKLLDEALTQLCNCFNVQNDEDQAYIESLLGRAESLGVEFE